MTHKYKLNFNIFPQTLLCGLFLLIVLSLIIGNLDIINHPFFLFGVIAIIILAITLFCPSLGIAILIFSIPLDFLNTRQIFYSTSLYQILLPLVFIGFCLNSFYFKKQSPFRKSEIDFYLLIFFLLLTISFLKSFWIPNAVPVFAQRIYNVPFARGLTRIFVLVHSIMLCYLIFWFIDSEKRLKQVLKWFFISGFFISLLGLLSWIGHRYGLFLISNFLVLNTMSSIRISSTFNEPIHLGMYLMMIIPSAIFIFISKIRSLNYKSKFLWVFLIMVLIITLFLTFSRAAWAAFAAIIYFYLLFGQIFASNEKERLTHKRYRKILFCGLVLFLMTTLIFYPKLPQKGFEKIKDAIDPQNGLQFWSTKSRLILVYHAFDLFLANPILGIGYDNFAFYFFESLPDLGMMDKINFTETNNLPIKILAELGLVGFIVLSFIAVSFLFNLIKTIRKTNNPFYKYFLIGGFLTLIGLFFQYQFISRIPIPVVWLFLGILVSGMHLSKKEECLKIASR